MALIPEVVATGAGATPAPRAAAAADTVNPAKDIGLFVNNQSAGAVTVTVVAVKPCSQGALHDLSVSVPAAQTRLIGPIDERFANNVTGLAAVNYSATASVTVYVARI